MAIRQNAECGMEFLVSVGNALERARCCSTPEREITSVPLVDGECRGAKAQGERIEFNAEDAEGAVKPQANR